jgi:hypothetical protein
MMVALGEMISLICWNVHAVESVSSIACQYSFSLVLFGMEIGGSFGSGGWRYWFLF